MVAAAESEDHFLVSFAAVYDQQDPLVTVVGVVGLTGRIHAAEVATLFNAGRLLCRRWVRPVAVRSAAFGCREDGVHNLLGLGAGESAGGQQRRQVFAGDMLGGVAAHADGVDVADSGQTTAGRAG